MICVNLHTTKETTILLKITEIQFSRPKEQRTIYLFYFYKHKGMKKHIIHFLATFLLFLPVATSSFTTGGLVYGAKALRFTFNDTFTLEEHGDTVEIKAIDFQNFSYANLFALHSEYQNKILVYPKNDTINLSIPSGMFIGNSYHSTPPSIPVNRVDFNGTTFNVTNTNKDTFIFIMSQSSQKLTEMLGKNDIDKGDISYNESLNKGRILLDIKDARPWAQRTDVNDDRIIYRRDILLLENGKALNSPIAPYNTPSTEVSAETEYVRLSNIPGFIKNVTFVRNSQSTEKSYPIFIHHRDGVTLENIKVLRDTTGGNDLHGDRCFRIKGCTNITLRDIVVENTYSQSNKYGYAFELDNVYNIKCYNIKAYKCKWGVFGSTNVNKAYFENCTLNRLDLHCYGRDFECVNCTFQKSDRSDYNSTDITNFYGTLRYRGCNFNNFQPHVVDVSYNIYTGCDLIFENCSFNLGNRSYQLVSLSGLAGNTPLRPENRQKCLPNITLRDVTFSYTGPNDFTTFRIFVANDGVENLGNINRIVLSNVTATRTCILEFDQKNSITTATTELPLSREINGGNLTIVEKNATRRAGQYHKYF